METQDTRNVTNFESKSDRQGRSGRLFAGLIIVTVGTLFLADNLGVDLPRWLLSLDVLFIVVGLYIGYRHSFKGAIWIIFVAIGSVMLADDLVPDLNMRHLIWPSVIIAIGLIIMFKPKKRYEESIMGVDTQNDPSDMIDQVVVFGGVKKKVISKTFRGGELTNVFGGTELDLMQADVQGRVVLEVTQVFGGVKLIVPPHWRIQSEELVAIFGGLDDKRPIRADVNPDTTRTLVLRGTCLFGGIDIKSY